ncbi:MAG: hypothetical protein V3U72_04880 [Candidatus Aenigmarchaeota archaeon]
MKKINFSDINAGNIKNMMNYKLPGTMYSNALLLTTEDGGIFIEHGNNLFEVQKTDSNYGYLQHVANMKNPHV